MSCPDQLIYFRDPIAGGECLCMDKYYDDGLDNVDCQPCHQSCATCDGPISVPNDCLTCPNLITTFRDDNLISNGSCPCKYGYYEELGNEICQLCPHECDDCD